MRPMHYSLFFPWPTERSGDRLGYGEQPGDRQYESVYSATIDAPDHAAALALIWERHTNGDSEESRAGEEERRRMYVGDIVLFDEGGADSDTAFIVETAGFREIGREEVSDVFPDAYLGELPPIPSQHRPDTHALPALPKRVRRHLVRTGDADDEKIEVVIAARDAKRRRRRGDIYACNTCTNFGEVVYHPVVTLHRPDIAEAQVVLVSGPPGSRLRTCNGKEHPIYDFDAGRLVSKGEIYACELCSGSLHAVYHPIRED